MSVWVSIDGGLTRRQPLEVLRRPRRFPRFHRRSTESPTQSAQRWRTEYLTLSKSQHEYLLALACYAVVDSKGLPSLNLALAEYEEDLLRTKSLQLFSWTTAEPKEVTIVYKLTGSSRTHQLTVSIRSPSEDFND